MSRTLIPSVSPSLLALKPRQVLLSRPNMAPKPHAGTPDSDHGVSLEPEQRTLLLHAVAFYLDRNGFSKTLKKFRSEAQIEKDSSKDFLLSLEEMCHKYLKKCNEAITAENKQVNVKTSKDVADDRVSEAQEEPKKKSKNKKSKKDVVPETQADTVEKEKSQSVHVESLKNSKGPEPPEGTTVHKEAGKKSKDKKKKKNKEKVESCATISDDGNVSRDPQAVDSITLNGNAANPEEKAAKSKTKKKKVESCATICNDGNVSRDPQAVDSITLNGNAANPEEKAAKSKTKKKKDSKHLSDENSNQLMAEDLEGTVNKNDCIKAVQEQENNDHSKKRKRLASEVQDSHTSDEKETEDVKRRKLEGSNECNDGVQPIANVEKTGERTSTKKAMKKDTNGSAEPKTINAFQRVKVDAVTFADEKLADNSYWAKGGAENGYGAKAQEILGQVKGRGFRHEKTKKKRGSYRGGVIDLQSHSVKFNYSDEE